MTQFEREIVKIDEEKCDGCGICIPSCAEGAIQVIDGKAKLVADNLCDGIGNCLGICPKGAIKIEKRSAAEFDEEAVSAHLGSAQGGAPHENTAPEPAAAKSPMPCGCPGSMSRQLSPQPAANKPATTSAGSTQSQLGHWPVQLKLLPLEGPLWHNADVLIAADCVSVAMPDFHERLLKGHSVAVGCPKLDDLAFYEGKLTEIFKSNPIKSVTVAHMEVPCCSGIVVAVRNAMASAGKSGLFFNDVMVGVDGKIKE
jgi:NAD-dependent dihydropyrimidine dehydrogenase PreA subunit